MRRVTVNGRWPLQVPDHLSVWDRPDGWEVERLAAMHDAIGHGSTVLYVGAADGDMPALLASWGASMVLIEPGERVWANIRAVWDANRLRPPVACFPGFAYDVTRGLVRHLEWPASSAGPMIDDHGFRNFVERPEIPSIRIDDLAGQNGLAPTDISVDVEGSEWRVLRGAEWVLETYRPRLWVSIHPDFMWELLRDSATEMNRWIRERGYRGQWIHELHMLYTPVEVS